MSDHRHVYTRTEVQAVQWGVPVGVCRWCEQLAPDYRRCARCQRAVQEIRTFIRIDESNESITQNSGLYCGPCADILEPRLSGVRHEDAA